MSFFKKKKHATIFFYDWYEKAESSNNHVAPYSGGICAVIQRSTKGVLSSDQHGNRCCVTNAHACPAKGIEKKGQKKGKTVERDYVSSLLATYRFH